MDKDIARGLRWIFAYLFAIVFLIYFTWFWWHMILRGEETIYFSISINKVNEMWIEAITFPIITFILIRGLIKDFRGVKDNNLQL